MTNLHDRLLIPDGNLAAINALLLNPDSRVIDALLKVVEKYGTPEEINRQAAEARQLDRLLARLDEIHSPYRAEASYILGLIELYDPMAGDPGRAVAWLRQVCDVETVIQGTVPARAGRPDVTFGLYRFKPRP